MEQTRQTTILVVDDDHSNRRYLEVLLAGEGYAVCMAASGEDALAAVAAQLPDLILLDILLPGIDGFEVARRLKADPGSRLVPIIMVTSLDDRSSRIRGRDAGAEEFLTKPVNRADLQIRVRNLLKIKEYNDFLANHRRVLEEQLEELAAEELLHELQVHQVELEMQNETLRHTQIDMEKSRDRYVNLYEFAPTGYLTLTLDAIILEINLTGAALLGIERHRLINSRFARFIAAQDRERWHRHFLEVKNDNSTTACELVFRRGDGSVFPARLDCLYVETGNGEPSVRITITDITGRVQAEKKLLESELKFSTMFDKSVFPIALSRLPNAEFADVNEAWIQLFGYSREEVKGKTPQELGIGNDPAKRARIIAELSQRGSVRDAEVTLATKFGDTRTISVNMDMLEMGGQKYALSTIRDITVCRRTETELTESRQSLRELAARDVTSREAELKHIAREIHDELGQVLTALRMDVSLLRIQFGDRDPVLLKKIQDMLLLVDKAIQGVRDVTVNLRPPALDMGLIAAIAWLREEFSKHTTVACTLRVNDDPPGLDDACTVALFRIVQESLTNIARHAAANSVEIIVRRCGGNLVVEVRDDGKGFDPEVMPGKKSFGLLGMRERAIAVGGKVEITSAASTGTVVSVSVPAVSVESFS